MLKTKLAGYLPASALDFVAISAGLVKGVEKNGELETVNTVLITSSREQVPMNYTLQNVGQRWAVVDLSVEGVSLVNHYRQAFSRFLANKPFSELLQQLKRKLGVHE